MNNRRAVMLIDRSIIVTIKVVYTGVILWRGIHTTNFKQLSSSAQIIENIYIVTL